MKETMEQCLAAKTKKPERHEEDYLVDGVLYCGKCRTKKQLLVSLFGKEALVGCLCKCQTEARDAEILTEQKAAAEKKLSKLRSAAFPEEYMKEYRFDRDDGKNPRVSKMCKNFVHNFKEMKERRRGLLLYGPVGTGKTFMGAAIANELVEKGIPCLVTNFSRLTNTLFGLTEGRQEFLDSLNEYDLIVIDDLGAERDTEYMLDQVYTIIDSRSRSGKLLIVTTNLTAKEMKSTSNASKSRIYSRLFGMCYPIEMLGEDRRKANLIDSYSELTGILENTPD